MVGEKSTLSADLVATLNGSATYVFELDSILHDVLTIANPDPSVFDTHLDLNNAPIAVELLHPGVSLTPGTVIDLLNVDFVQGTYSSLILPELGALVLDDSNFLTDGTLTVVNLIPEPATLSLLALGSLELLRRRRRTR